MELSMGYKYNIATVFLSILWTQGLHELEVMFTSCGQVYTPIPIARAHDDENTGTCFYSRRVTNLPVKDMNNEQYQKSRCVRYSEVPLYVNGNTAIYIGIIFGSSE